MKIPTYFTCGDCGQIEESPAWEGLRYKCKHCHKSSNQYVWPTPDTRQLFEFILSIDEKSPHYSEITSVFLSSVLELLLENLLSVMAFEDLLYEKADMLVDALLEGYQGRSRMFALYSKIGYGTFHEVVSKMGKEQFLNNWDTIVQARNNVVHGKFKERKNINPKLVETTVIDALYVFSNLHNQYNAESLAYRAAMEDKNHHNQGV